MDKGPKYEKMHRVLKKQQEKPHSVRPAFQVTQWDSVESDTESLAQERAYQQQLQMNISRHHQSRYIQPQKENDYSLLPGDGADEYVHDGDTEYLHIYDSLEAAAAHLHVKGSPILLQREGTSQLLSDADYSDLCYDPNWRRNLTAAAHFKESPQTSVEEYYQVPKEKSSQTHADRQEVVIKGGYRYIADTHPAVMVTPPVAVNESDLPYRLHPQVTSPHCHSHALQLRSQEAHLSSPSRTSTKSERDSLQTGFKDSCENICDNDSENMSRSPELMEEKHAVYVQEFLTYNQQEERRMQARPTQTHPTSTLTSPKVLSPKKLERLTEDIVERNKVTLGRNKTGYSSYVMGNETRKEMTSSDPELRWLQKTQQLKVTQISRGKKAQQKGNPSPPQQQQPPALGIRAEQGYDVSPPLARPLKMSSSQPLPPTIHLNINLNTSSHLHPFQHKRQDAIISLASLHGCPHWIPASEAELALFPRYQQTNQESSQRSQKGSNPQLHHRNLESSPEQWQRAFRCLSSCERGDKRRSPNEVHSQEVPQDLTGTNTTTSYRVLPPIGKPLTGREAEMSPALSVNTADRIHRSSSDSYLVQMEKQRQRARGTYKAYSLKDYKQLKSDINLQGLGPDYTAIEKTGQKLKRQRLYSNVIREQNKKISRIPFLPAKDPEGSDKNVPRRKALEYAKTIAKPLVQSKPKQRQKHQTEGPTELAPYLEGMDLFQPAALDVLRKRHEEEKQAVALFRKDLAV
uniref:jhy protein homolog n=1 Tax=Semicossyphus pulcher TaxID=241346 RepID=UPI0037E9069A